MGASFVSISNVTNLSVLLFASIRRTRPRLEFIAWLFHSRLPDNPTKDFIRLPFKKLTSPQSDGEKSFSRFASFKIFQIFNALNHFFNYNFLMFFFNIFKTSELIFLNIFQQNKPIEAGYEGFLGVCCGRVGGV